MSYRMDELVKARRKALENGSLPRGASEKWGLALSGGGIRSATFCLGLIRSLARHGTLLRFDMLSTVSGGGYVGSMIGGLFNRAKSPQEARQIEEAIGERNDAWFLWWLRANGRYLIPSGIKDTVFVLGMFLRNLVGVHFEFGLLALLLGIALAAVDLAGWAAVARIGFLEPAGTYFELLRWLPAWFPVVWFALPVAVGAGAVYAAAYWALQWVQRANWKTPLLWLFVLLAGLGFVWAFWRYVLGSGSAGGTVRAVLGCAVAAAILIWLMAVPVAWRCVKKLEDSQPRELLDAEARNFLTRRLALCLNGFGVVLALGLVDRLAWVLAFEQEGLVDTGAFLVVAAAILRASLPLASSISKRPGAARLLMLAGQALGYFLAFLLCAWWVSIVFTAAIGASVLSTDFQYGNAAIVLAVLAAPILGYIALTGRNFAFLNQSSLHAYYKARLTRSYLGAANAERFRQGGGLGALEKVPNVLLASIASKRIDKVMPGDDMLLGKYQPQCAGGPVHLINVCVNQTKDPRGGLFNRDRLGLPMTVASGGWMNVARKGWRRLRAPGQLSVGTWMAISGAAVAPGLGNRTRAGLSALMMFAGARVGYWWSLAERLSPPGDGAKRLRAPCLAKSRGLLNELFGVFKGTKGADWFLTDGGHFENTGAYALLAERASVIVLADCGADPRYAFGDLENLVRKARIDLNAEILFQRPKAGGACPAGFGSLNELASATGTACLALAHIVYDGNPETAGILILVKPNLCDGLPVDLVNFKDQNHDFPQQTTADQFFSEAQWESYYHLGQFMGRNLSPAFIAKLLTDSADEFEADERLPYGPAEADARPQAGNGKGDGNGRLPARITATAVGTTIGLGAAATIGVSAWQFVDNARMEAARKESQERSALKELTELWWQLPPRQDDGFASPSSPQAYGRLAAELLRVSDTLCPADDAGWFLRSPLAQRIANDGVHGCQALDWSQRSESCHVLVETASHSIPNAIPNCVFPAGDRKEPAPRYWIYDYGRAANAGDMHPCDPLQEDGAARRRVYVAQYGPSTTVYPAVREVSEATPEAAKAAAEKRCRIARDEAVGITLAEGPGSVVSMSSVSPSPLPSGSQPEPGSEPKPAPEPASPATTVQPAKADSCQRITVYMQIYGGAQRDEVRQFRSAWRQLGANVPPIEDVVATAENAGRATPQPVSQTTVRYHDDASLECANALNQAAKPGETWKVERLSARLKPSPRTVEVWFAPRASGGGN